MRKKIAAANWKMNTTVPEGIELAKSVRQALEGVDRMCDVVLGVPFTHLCAVAEAVKGTDIIVAAENCATEPKGAYTGEVSAAMVASTGAKAVILGHSERRQYYSEDSETLVAKVAQALDNGLQVIFCCGEDLEERKDGRQFDVVRKELEDGIFNLSEDEFRSVVIAYEPIWAIGTGETATSEQAEEMLKYIRQTIADRYGKEVAEETSILYGGSCNGKNAPELFAKPNVDGGLIGGASLSAEKFLPIVEAF